MTLLIRETELHYAKKVQKIKFAGVQLQMSQLLSVGDTFLMSLEMGRWWILGTNLSPARQGSLQIILESE